MLTGEAGGPADVAARLLGPGASANLGQNLVVDNRPWIIAVQTAAKAPPDGYTLLIYASIIWIAPLMRDDLPWDPLRDFAPITLVGSSPNVLVVHPSLPVKSVAGLIALAKARPGELNCATGPGGSTTHLAAESFAAATGVKFLRVPYKGNVPALAALAGGDVQLMFASTTSAMPYVRSGRLRALAVTSARRSALAPGLPPIAAAGLPGFDVAAIMGIFAPVKTPATVIERLNRDIVQSLNRPEVKEKFMATGIEVVGSSPEQLSATMKSEMARFGRIIKAGGIQDK
jgi:tripartite-type tricarboxylate transporter receptor subunit TctC